MKSHALILISVILLPLNALALGGTVTHLPGGTLTLKTKLGEKKIKEKDKVPSGATLTLKDGETAIIQLDDGSLIKLKGDSEIILTGDPTPTVELTNGAAFAQVKPAEKKDTLAKPRFIVRARGVVMGVRGTEFFTALGPKDNVWMCVGKGVVEAGKASDTAKVTVKEGEGILVEKEKKIDPPKSYEWTKKLNWNMDPASGEVKDESKLESEYGNLLRQTYD